LVALADFVSAVDAASSGSHVVTGVCAQLPEGTTGLVVPPDVTATVLALDGHACTLPTTALRAPASCMRGQTRIHKLCYVQLGLKQWPLRWEPLHVDCNIPLLPTTTLRAMVFQRFLCPDDWLRCRANSKLALRTMIQRLPGLDPDALVDLFDFRRSTGPEDAFC
jgi:hypothetical protein